MIQMKNELMSQIRAFGERAFPEECVGVLLGKSEEWGRAVQEVLPLKNCASSRRTAFLVADSELRVAEERARAKSLDVVGFYHSHADFAAVASEADADFAIPALSYPIVSVVGGKAVAVKSFSYNGGFNRANFREEEIVCL